MVSSINPHSTSHLMKTDAIVLFSFGIAIEEYNIRDWVFGELELYNPLSRT